MAIESGCVIYAESPADDVAIGNARVWIRGLGYTSDNVRMVKRGESVVVIWR